MTAEEELIELRQRNSLLEEQVKQLTEQGKRLQEQLAKSSQNSSLPPSSDRSWIPLDAAQTEPTHLYSLGSNFARRSRRTSV